MLKVFIFDLGEMEICEKMILICKVIVKVMVNSKYIVFYVILYDEVEVFKLWDYCKKFKDVVVVNGIKLIFLLYVVKVLILIV